jgi:8-oxo-dGTP pyrophosphatase MutT (NUDIX family)
MLFTEFTKFLPNIQTQQLPAISAHIKMAPLERHSSLKAENYLHNNPLSSAVMMLFYKKNNQAHFVLIKRNTYPGIHSAQISFPGGKAETEDKDLAHTALRETFEEIGINQEDIEIVMPFSELYIPPSNFLVYPFLGISLHELTFIPNPDEVSQIIEVPLTVLLDDASVINSPVATSYAQDIMVPAFNIGGHIVWGATAMILNELKETIKSAMA